VTGSFEGWFDNPDGSHTFIVGYLNRNTRQVLDIPIGDANRIEPGGPDQGQPTHFVPGRHKGVFTVTVPKTFTPAERLTWTLTANARTTAIPLRLHPDYVLNPFQDVAVDNTPPIAEITEPTACSYVEGVVTVRGVVGDAHLDSWVLQFTGDGVHGWQTIASGDGPAGAGVLGQWDTTNLPPCAYALRLLVSDAAVVDCNGVIHNTSEYTVTVNVGFCGDFDVDDDGDVDLTDYSSFENVFTGPN